MVAQVEPRRAGEHILFEVDRNYCRDQGVILSGQNLKVGQVLARIATGAAVMTAHAGNAANTGAAAAVVVGAGAKVGRHTLFCIEPGTNAGKFLHFDPDGIPVGVLTVGVAYDKGGIATTLPDGATDFISGEGFDIDVAAGSLKYRAIDFASAVGAEVAVAVLVDAVDASTADKPCVVSARITTLNGLMLEWPAGATDNQKAVASAQLATHGLIVRS